MRLVKITSQEFIAKVGIDQDSRVTHAEPMVNFMKGWSMFKVHAHCETKGWFMNTMPNEENHDAMLWTE